MLDRVIISIYDNDIDKRYELRKNTVLADKSLTNDEKSKVISLLNESYDHNKIFYHEGKKDYVKIVNKNVLQHYIVSIAFEAI